MRGTGYAHCHHGEILQGMFRDRTGTACRGLVTLPMALHGARAEFTWRPERPADDVTVVPADRTKARQAAVLALRACTHDRHTPACGGELRLTGDVPVGLGMGSSTSDVIASVRAVADSHDVELAAGTVARLAVRAECASDPLMLQTGALLFAQREGRVLETFGDALPPTVVIGCTTDGGRQVDTLGLPATACRDDDLDEFEHLRTMLRRAVAANDVGLLGRVSTLSARRNQRVLPKAELAALERIAADTGAVGVQVAHSGNVAGVLFDPATPDLPRRLRRCVDALIAEGIDASRVFRTGQEHVRHRGGHGCTTTSRTRSGSRGWSARERASSA